MARREPESSHLDLRLFSVVGVNGGAIEELSGGLISSRMRVENGPSTTIHRGQRYVVECSGAAPTRPWERTVAYICSAANNVRQISAIVESVAEALGPPLEIDGDVRVAHTQFYGTSE